MSSESAAILIGGKDDILSKSLELALQASDFSWKIDRVRTLSQPVSSSFDVALVFFDGDLENNLKHIERVPTLVLDRHKEKDEVREIVALRAGADYMHWSVDSSTNVLDARLRALHRHQERMSGTMASNDRPAIRLKKLVINPSRHECLYLGVPVDLTATEMNMLIYMVSPPGHVHSREQLMEHGFGEYRFEDERVVDSHIKRMRAKFKSIDPKFNDIETLYAFGYCYKEKNIQANAQSAVG